MFDPTAFADAILYTAEALGFAGILIGIALILHSISSGSANSSPSRLAEPTLAADSPFPRSVDRRPFSSPGVE